MVDLSGSGAHLETTAGTTSCESEGFSERLPSPPRTLVYSTTLELAPFVKRSR